MFSDKVLSCKECGCEFVFSAAEQEFYVEKGFANEPGRCPECRAARKAQVRSNKRRSSYNEREMYPARCSSCGKITTLPFQPSGDRPVYCRDCYQQQRRASW